MAVNQIDKLDRLGIDEERGRLYWDGKEILARTQLSELLRMDVAGVPINFVAVGALAGAVTAIVNLLRLLKEWGVITIAVT